MYALKESLGDALTALIGLCRARQAAALDLWAEVVGKDAHAMRGWSPTSSRTAGAPAAGGTSLGAAYLWQWIRATVHGAQRCRRLFSSP